MYNNNNIREWYTAGMSREFFQRSPSSTLLNIYIIYIYILYFRHDVEVLHVSAYNKHSYIFIFIIKILVEISRLRRRLNDFRQAILFFSRAWFTIISTLFTGFFKRVRHKKIIKKVSFVEKLINPLLHYNNIILLNAVVRKTQYYNCPSLIRVLNLRLA